MVASMSIFTSVFAEGDLVVQTATQETAPVVVQAQTIVNSMEFQGESQKLTLDEAIQIMLKDNIAIKQCELDLAQVKVQNITDEEDLADYKRALKNDDKYDDVKKKFFMETKNSITMSGLEKLVREKELKTSFNMANAERELEATKKGLKADVEQSYYSLLQAQETVRINKENLDIAKDLQDKTQKKEKLGLVAKQEVLNSELHYIKAKSQYEASIITAKNAKMSFNSKLGKNVMDNVELTDELKAKEFDPNTVNIADAIKSALEKRYDLKSLELNYELEKITMEDVASQYTETMYPYQKEKLKVEKMQKDLENAKLRMEIEVRSNYLQILQKKEEIESGIKAVEVSEQAWKLSEISNDAGMNVLTDVEQAQLSYSQAKLSLSKAILDYNTAILKFQDSIDVGRISGAEQMAAQY